MVLLLQSIPEIEKPRDVALAFEAKWNAEKPKGASDFFFSTSSGLFTSMRMQKEYVASTMIGVLLALGLAFGSLVVFVGNFIVASLAFACIAAVVTCTLGLMVLQGWSLGAIEAICATIVVGFSVDYIVHYSLAYIEAPEKTRSARVTRALVDVGISVQSGAITTIGASIFLFATQIQFLFKVWRRACQTAKRHFVRAKALAQKLTLLTFVRMPPTPRPSILPVLPAAFCQFGVFMMETVAFSLIIANFLFCALLAIVGPENDSGSLRWLCGRFGTSTAKKEAAAGVTPPMVSAP